MKTKNEKYLSEMQKKIKTHKTHKWWPKNRPTEISELGYNFFLIIEKKIKCIQKKALQNDTNWRMIK